MEATLAAPEAQSVGDVLPDAYLPDRVEIVSRRLKMEYVGMASVFAVIFLVFFFGAPSAVERSLATLSSYFLFLGLKKKTRDHLVTSFLMFAAAALGLSTVVARLWIVPLALFGMCAWALEGYLEKRRGRIRALPAVLGAFAWTSALWPLAAAFVGTYLLQPRPDAPGLRRKLAWTALPAIGIAALIAWYRDRSWAIDPGPRLALDRLDLLLYASIAIPTALCLATYWRRLAIPHRVNGVGFLVAGAFDERLLGMFGISAAIVLAATVFRQSVDSLRWRGAFKHAEWYYFWVIASCAVVLILVR